MLAKAMEESARVERSIQLGTAPPPPTSRVLSPSVYAATSHVVDVSSDSDSDDLSAYAPAPPVKEEHQFEFE